MDELQSSLCVCVLLYICIFDYRLLISKRLCARKIFHKVGFIYTAAAAAFAYDVCEKICTKYCLRGLRSSGGL
jgi:hypothetical protein